MEECGSVRDGILTIGKECYSRLVVSDDLVWTDKGKELLDRFVKGGGQVVSYEDYKVVKGQDYLVRYTSPNAALYQLNNAIDLEQQDWQFAPPIENKLLMQWNANGDSLECPIQVEELTDEMFPMTLSISDKVAGAYFNGAKLESQRRNRNGFDIYPITKEMFVPGKEQMVKVDVSGCKEKQPFAFFNGRFLVKNRTGYTQFGKRAYTQLKTKYDFYLTPYAPSRAATCWKPLPLCEQAHHPPSSNLRSIPIWTTPRSTSPILLPMPPRCSWTTNFWATPGEPGGSSRWSIFPPIRIIPCGWSWCPTPSTSTAPTATWTATG